MSEGVYYVIGGLCEHEDTGKEKCLDAYLWFEDEDLFQGHTDSMFEDTYDKFDQWLQENGHDGWYACDILETVSSISERDAKQPIRVYRLK